MLDLVALDPMYISGSLVLFVQIFKAPDLTQVSLSHHLISILLGTLDLGKHGQTLLVESKQLVAGRVISCQAL